MALPLVQIPQAFRGPLTAPTCLRCGKETKRHVTRRSNRNGNVGRPYYRCPKCNKFATFADERGNVEANPICKCGHPSRRQVSGQDRGRTVHYVCRSGRCEFFVFQRTPEGEIQSLTDDMVGRLARLRLV